MAVPEAYFTPGQWQGSVGDQALRDPRITAPLLQAGLSLMSGGSWGDNGPSMVARAIGSGGEALGRQETALRLQQEADSKAEARAAQAEAAQARAGQAGSNADIARARLELATADMQRKRDAMLGSSKIRAALMYSNYANKVNERNTKGASNVLMRPGEFKPEPVLSPEDWAKANAPSLHSMGLFDTPAAAGGALAGASTSGTPDEPGAATSGSTPQSYPQAPRDPKTRTPNTVYDTPKGPHLWTGTIWQSLTPGG